MFKFNLGFGGVTAPMEYPLEQQRTPTEPLPEIPEMKDASTGTIRLAGTLDTRLPSMPGGDLDNLRFSNAKQIEAKEFTDDMRVSYAVSRGYDKRGKARAKARSHQMNRQLKNSGSQGKRTRRQMQGQTKRMTKSTILRNARDVLGMGTDLYR